MSLPVRLFRVASEKKKLMSWLCTVQSSHTQMRGTLKYPPFNQFASQIKWPPTLSSTCSYTSFTSLASSLLPRANGHSLLASCLSPSFSTMPDSNQRPQEVPEGVVAILDYWLGSWAASGSQGEIEASEALSKLSLWFKKSQETDDTIRSRFSSLLSRAINGELVGWEATPHGALALLILLDQFSRNMFRDTPKAFAQDPAARAVARSAIANGFDKQLHPLATTFFYLPFEHSEDEDDQELSIQYFEALSRSTPDRDVGKALKRCLDFAARHKVVIDKFGRFPHRNAMLERESTPEEMEYLNQPGSGF